MADEAHIEVLNQGVKAWNDWRRYKPLFAPDLSGASLNGTNLSGRTEGRFSAYLMHL
jgi:hypothetical protein